MSPRWRYRCPHGHAVHKLGRNRINCHTCGASSDSYMHDKADMIDLADDRRARRCPWWDCSGRIVGPTNHQQDPGCQQCGRRPGLAVEGQ